MVKKCHPTTLPGESGSFLKSKTFKVAACHIRDNIPRASQKSVGRTTNSLIKAEEEA